MTTTSETQVRRAPRIDELDALRGLALAGIVMVNIIQMSHMPEARGEAADHPGAFVFELLFLQRPFPIFSFLFGVSFAIFLHTAERRTDRPRLVLLRRLIALGVLGGLHTLLQPGEVLKFYAAFGLLILLPASYLPRRWVLWIGVVLTLASALTFRGFTAIPGLFLLGMAATDYGLTRNLARSGRRLTIAFGIGVLLSVWLGILQWRAGVGPTAHFRSLPAGLAMAFMFMTGFLLLLRTRLRGPLQAVFAPMGRTALTNYVLATLLILAGDAIWHFGDRTDYGRVVVAGIAISAIQALLSPIWLRHFQYGPLEWLWRRATWWTSVPLRREPETPPRTTESPAPAAEAGGARP